MATMLSQFGESPARTVALATGGHEAAFVASRDA
jgi:hypothetical protein